MSTTRTTTTTNQYNQPSMGMFNQFQPQIGAGLTDYAQDPMKATYFNRQVQMMNQQNAGYANQANQQLMMNQRAMGGMSNPNAFMASQLARNQRAAQARSSQGFNQLLMQANQVRMGALGQMQGYRPLQIGQTSKESTGGLGSWLSPLISAGVGAFTGGFGGNGNTWRHGFNVSRRFYYARRLFQPTNWQSSCPICWNESASKVNNNAIHRPYKLFQTTRPWKSNFYQLGWGYVTRTE